MNDRYRTVVRHDGTDYFSKEYTLENEDAIFKQKKYLLRVVSAKDSFSIDTIEGCIMFPSEIIKYSIITLKKVNI